ncbi:fatty acyl-CoA reductase wat-like [Venturia canescens]|uniref:fatty acyl-CoA reductase wat-like n=1 Tax=Venturia canescens TaxID=32260 RepID=UPI001C9D3284|nr:fatty acyl-CoA reductase wat-like [Venturia canescens]
MLLDTKPLGSYTKTIEADNDHPALTDRRNVINNNNIEIRNTIEEDHITIAKGTTIQNFYAGQSLLITGGTGFLGKILVEKLLRSCPDISTIYLLIRAKKNKNVQDRVEDLFNDPIYDRLRKEVPKFRHKLVAISGDCSKRGLGLSSVDRERLTREVSIVFHGAATVRFDERIDIALAINAGSAVDMIDLCKHMERLKAVIHVSTAYANCHLSTIEEAFYPHTTSYDELKALFTDMGEKEMAKITPKLLGEWPNTYTFTKALAERVIKEKSQGLSIGIFRPAIIISTAFEPIPGWIDNFYGPTGAVGAIETGILKTMYCRHSVQANIVPVDFTVNALIVSAWDVASQPQRRAENMLIYNYVSTLENSITWKDYKDINLIHASEFPLSQAKWTVSVTLHDHKLMDFLSRIVFHYIPALVIDSFSICLGYKPKLLTTYRKLHRFIDVVSWFCVRDWTLTNNNVEHMWKRLETKDQQIFRFDMRQLNWKKYFKNYIKGVRVYLFKDDLSTLEASRKKSERFRSINATIKIFLCAISLLLFWKMLPITFS